MPEGINIKLELSTEGQETKKGSHISEEFRNQPLEKVQAIEKFFATTVREFVYKTLRG